MSNNDTITEGPRARALFVGREDLIAEFLRRVHRGAANVMFVYGEGGIGKTLLLHHLEDHYCRVLSRSEGHLLDPWTNIESLPAPELVSAFIGLPSIPLKHARIDFSSPVIGEDPQDEFFGLQMIRRKLGVPTPRFLAACVLYLKENNRLTKEWMDDIFPGATADLLSNVIDAGAATNFASLVHAAAQGAAAVHTGGASLAFGAIFKSMWGFAAEKVGPKFHTWQAKRRLRGSEFDDLSAYKADELLRQLPLILAEDINTSLDDERGPFALLFDSHNSFCGGEHQRPDKIQSERDRWLRKFLESLEREKGVTVVITGQEPPAWRSGPKVDEFPVAYLTAPEARTYLQGAGIAPGELSDAVIRYSSVSEGMVQPLFCAMLADAHLIGSKRGEPLQPDHLPEQGSVQERQKDILERLLAAAGGELKYAIEACAAARSFDLKLFGALGDALRFGGSRSLYETVTKLSCVVALGGGRFRMHALIRRFMGGGNAQREVHEACVAYFNEPASRSLADAVYHEYFLDVDAALGSWIAAFREAMRISLHGQCSALLLVRQELGDVAFDQFGAEVGTYLDSLSRYREAEQQFALTIEYWQSFASDDVGALNNKGSALQRWGDVSAKLARDADAERRYEQAVAAFDRALQLAPDYVIPLNNKGNALQRWGDVSAKLARDPDAERRYEQAVAAYDRALALDPDNVNALNNKGIALQSWGDVSAKLARDGDAERRYEQAVAAFDRALQLAPDDVNALNNKGNALQSWGDVSAKLARDAEAERRYEQAVAAFDRALQVAPDDVGALNNKGLALQRWGDVSAKLARDGDAERRYEQAMAAYDRALELAPDDVGALNNKGLALHSWGNVSAKLARDGDAEQRYGQAVAAYDRALQLAPDDVGALNNKGLALQRWGYVSAKLARDEDAERRYGQAVAAYDRALELAPDDVIALNNKGNALQSWGDVSAKLARDGDAERRYGQAVAAFDRALQLAPDYVGALNNKGLALQSWGDVSAKLARDADAERRYELAVAACDRALELAPGHIVIQSNREIAWERLSKFRPKDNADS